ncbi:hypothetical protein [Nannocystis pusilla]|uniref:Uncharacterized protein n=1 Tax=Nannocystis pusilla TaxID=889268 RepID=A0ABS7TRD9_9BACT|nr:hypothetical protein [Nannocystis pusilla]MBZ5710788.1 hypothetical protein [Nannocystis pusilla]
MTRFSTAFMRSLLAAPLALAFAACTFPKSLGDSLTESDTDDGPGGSDSATTTSAGAPPEPLTSTSTDGTGVITSTSTGVITETGGLSDTDDSATDASASEVTGDSATDVTGDPTATTVDSATTDEPEPVPGLCRSEWHGEYWCECTDSNTQACGVDGISVCFAQDDFVVTHTKWGPCGACAPGDQNACDIEGAPGRQFCNVADAWIDDINDLPTPDWGACILEADIACEPGQTMMCEDSEFIRTCVVDDQGVPHWTDC